MCEAFHWYSFGYGIAATIIVALILLYCVKTVKEIDYER